MKRLRMYRRLLAVPVLVLSAALAACGGAGQQAASPVVPGADMRPESKTRPLIVEYAKGIPPQSSPAYIAKGSDGAMWFTEVNSGAIGRIDRFGHVRQFTKGISKQAGSSGIALGPDGNMWFAELGNAPYSHGAIGRITPAGVVTEFSAGLEKSDQPFGIT